MVGRDGSVPDLGFVVNKLRSFPLKAGLRWRGWGRDGGWEEGRDEGSGPAIFIAQGCCDGE